MDKKKIHFLIGGDFMARKYSLKSDDIHFKYCFVYEHSYYIGYILEGFRHFQQGEK